MDNLLTSRFIKNVQITQHCSESFSNSSSRNFFAFQKLSHAFVTKSRKFRGDQQPVSENLI